MDFEREQELENAGIDAFDYSLMDEGERRAALLDAGLEPDEYDGIEFDDSFTAWDALQTSGTSLRELELMDNREKREALENAGLDPDDFDLDGDNSPGTGCSSGSRYTAAPAAPIIPKGHVAADDSPKPAYAKKPTAQPSKPEEKAPRLSEPKKEAVRAVPEAKRKQEEHTRLALALRKAKEQERKQAEIARIDRTMQRLRNVICILASALVILGGWMIFFIGENHAGQAVRKTAPSPPRTAAVRSTAAPRPTAAPTPHTSASSGTTGGLLGRKLTSDDGLYYLGGGGKVGGVSTQKYRYYDGTNTYVVYLDSRNIVQKAEAYLPNSSSKKSSMKKRRQPAILITQRIICIRRISTTLIPMTSGTMRTRKTTGKSTAERKDQRREAQTGRTAGKNTCERLRDGDYKDGFYAGHAVPEDAVAGQTPAGAEGDSAGGAGEAGRGERLRRSGDGDVRPV